MSRDRRAIDVPSNLNALSLGRSRGRREAIAQFLAKVWEYDPKEYTMLYSRRAGTDRMRPHPIRGDRSSEIADLLERFPPKEHDLYFCPNAFDRPGNKQEYALPTRFAWSDIDDADPLGFKPLPNILWETSQGRYQGLWVWSDAVPASVAEQRSKNLWNHYGGDRGAWAANKLLRIPGTINHKPTRNKERVRLLRCDWKPRQVPAEISDHSGLKVRLVPTGIIDPLDHAPHEVMRRYRSKMGLVAGTLMMSKTVKRPDRSGAVYVIVSKLIELGASDAEIASVLLVNPYFLDKWGSDVTKAEDQIARIRGRQEVGR